MKREANISMPELFPLAMNVSIHLKIPVCQQSEISVYDGFSCILIWKLSTAEATDSGLTARMTYHTGTIKTRSFHFRPELCLV